MPIFPGTRDEGGGSVHKIPVWMIHFTHILYTFVSNRIFATSKTEGTSVPNLLTDEFYTPTTLTTHLHSQLIYLYGMLVLGVSCLGVSGLGVLVLGMNWPWVSTYWWVFELVMGERVIYWCNLRFCS